MSDCLFCKIVAKTVPSTAVYEDADVYAFLDIHPVHPGHVLIVPKQHAQWITDLDDSSLGKVMGVVKKVGHALVKSMKIEGFNVLQNNGAVAGQAVFHTHIHVIPRHKDDGLVMWPSNAYASDEQKQEIAEQLRHVLEQV